MDVAAYIQAHALLNPRAKALVAFSGGADSLALLIMLRRLGYAVHALHCNFHLRGEESDRDERFVRQWCESHEVPLDVEHFDTRQTAKARGISLEMAARDLRYAWFHTMKETTGAEAIAVAHHLDDQAETLLLNLMRGTGLRGLAGMHPKSGDIIRPLLSTTKAEILSFLEAEGETFVVDSTNQEREARRNRLRLDVLPLLRLINPQATRHLAEAAAHIQDALPYYRRGVAETLKDLGATPDCLPTEGLTPLLLHEWLAGKGFHAATENHIFRELHGPSGAVYASPTHRLLRDRGRLLLETIVPLKLLTTTLNKETTTQVLPTLSIEVHEAELCKRPASDDGRTEALDLDRLPHPLGVRFVQQGDTFHPLGMEGRRLVSDFLTDRKCNLFERERQLVVTHDDDIVWVVGQRIDHRFRITQTTKRLLVLRQLVHS